MSKYSKEFPLTVVKRYLSGATGGYKSVGHHYDVDGSIVRTWVKRYQHHGADGFDKKFRHSTAEFTLSVLRHMGEKKLSGQETAILFDIRNKGIVNDGERRYPSGGIPALTPRTRGRPKAMTAPPKVQPQQAKTDENRRREELLQEVNYLRMENAYLKKLKALVQEQAQAASVKRRK